MSNFRKALRAHTADQLAQPGEHNRDEMAQAFLAEHADLAEIAMQRLVERQVGSLIKEMCDADPEQEMLAVFDGLPAAIATGPGSVKAIEYCTPEDLELGEQHRRDNITSARSRLARYRKGVTKYLTERQGDETVGATAERISTETTSAAS